MLYDSNLDTVGDILVAQSNHLAPKRLGGDLKIGLSTFSLGQGPAGAAPH